jgi:hypothetical protein
VKDDAVAPVVAAMLVLAIIVTVVSLWNAVLIPSLKQESEIVHIREAEAGVLRFASDIDTAAGLKRNLHLSERIPLGGGDIPLNSIKSGGRLRVMADPSAYARVTITNITGSADQHELFLANYSYMPVENFWQDQGYTWSYGNVNVTNRGIETPLESATMDDAAFAIAGSLIDVEPVPSPDDPSVCSFLILRTVNITPADNRVLVSGNGVGTLGLTSAIRSRTIDNTTVLELTLNPYKPEGFFEVISDAKDRQVKERILSCGNAHLQATPSNQARFTFDANPNFTVVREITEISISAS